MFSKKELVENTGFTCDVFFVDGIIKTHVFLTGIVIWDLANIYIYINVLIMDI